MEVIQAYEYLSKNFPCSTDCLIYPMCRTKLLKVQNDCLSAGYRYNVFLRFSASYLSLSCSLFKKWYVNLLPTKTKNLPMFIFLSEKFELREYSKWGE